MNTIPLFLHVVISKKFLSHQQLSTLAQVLFNIVKLELLNMMITHNLKQ